ncbi:MAG: hypothetical protein IPM54_40325 [Polyangiaceae bacterium]|nr:hypothetical protein [Polyangiaceae bacterium]
MEAAYPFATYSWDIVALFVSILLEANRPAEALTIAQEAISRLETLGVGGVGEIHLRLAHAEALHAAGKPEAARGALLVTLDKLRLRMNNIPDASARERYVTNVPPHARLFALAKEWLGDIDVRERIGLTSA